MVSKTQWLLWYVFANDTNIFKKLDRIEQILEQLFFRGTFVSFVILFFKDTNDLLEGISKLDNKVMISRFQRLVTNYRKNPNLVVQTFKNDQLLDSECCES